MSAFHLGCVKTRLPILERGNRSSYERRTRRTRVFHWRKSRLAPKPRLAGETNSLRPLQSDVFTQPRPKADYRPTCLPCSLATRTLAPRLRTDQVAGFDRITVCAEFLHFHQSQDGPDRRCFSPRTCRSSSSSGGVGARRSMIAPCARRAGPSGTRCVSTPHSG